MADQSTQSITVAAPPADVMAVIADFPSYPEWVAAAKQVDVLETGPDGRARRVHFVLDAGAVKDDYVLEYTWDGDRRVSWQLVRARCRSGRRAPTPSRDHAGQHRGHLRHRHRPLHPDARDDQAQGEKVILDTALKELKKRVEG
jgi:hypothetical protein